MKMDKLTRSEENLMEVFWSSEQPLSSVEIVKLAEEHSWKSSYVHIMLRSLEKKNMIKVCGTLQCGTQYARQFIPDITREEYAAKLALSTGITEDSIARVTVALARQVGNDEELIDQLEEIIAKLKE